MEGNQSSHEAAMHLAGVLRGEINPRFTADYGTPLCDILSEFQNVDQVAQNVLAALKPLIGRGDFGIYLDGDYGMRLLESATVDKLPEIRVDFKELTAKGFQQTDGIVVVYLEYMGMSVTVDGE